MLYLLVPRKYRNDILTLCRYWVRKLLVSVDDDIRKFQVVFRICHHWSTEMGSKRHDKGVASKKGQCFASFLQLDILYKYFIDQQTLQALHY